jgi:hypothetical protein
MECWNALTKALGMSVVVSFFVVRVDFFLVNSLAKLSLAYVYVEKSGGLDEYSARGI